MNRNQAGDKKQLIAQLEKTPITEAACNRVGLPRATYYRWRKDDEAFALLCDETIDRSIGRVNDLAESQLINAIKNQNLGAITFWLKHHSNRYRSRVEIDARVRTVQQELTTEQIQLVTEALKLAGINLEGEQDNVK